MTELAKPLIDLWWELETACNLRCKFCYNFWKDGRAKTPARVSTEDTLNAMVRLLDHVDCRQLAISGGEPLLRPDLPRLLHGIRDYRAHRILTTNGILLGPQRIAALASDGVTSFQVSFHSHIEETHDRLSGRRCWEAALQALLAVREAGLDVTPVFVATRLNVNHLANVVDIVAQLGIRSLIFNRFIPTGLGALHKETVGVPTDRELWDSLRAATRTASTYGLVIHLGVPIHSPSPFPIDPHILRLASCPVREGQRRWTVGSDLSVRRCNHSGEAIGNLLDDGLERLLSELSRQSISGCQSVHPCQFLEPSYPASVRLTPAPTAGISVAQPRS